VTSVVCSSIWSITFLKWTRFNFETGPPKICPFVTDRSSDLADDGVVATQILEPVAPLPVPPEIELEPAAQAALVGGCRVELSRREFALLHLLLAHAGQTVSRVRIVDALWNGECAANIVDVYVNYLRRKLGDPALIRTVRGVGYQFAASRPETQSFAWPRRGPSRVEPLPGMIGDSAAMQPVYRLARCVAPRDAAVLITGATGTGKELVAQAIHALSPRASRSLVTINCAAIPDTLLESELFGCTRGAFTGAVQSRLGRIHGAQGGTLFLDEIGELSLSLQAKLLRFLESGELQRLGSPDVFQMDVRVIAASNADLQRKVRACQFRDDLYYRLAVFPIALPALAERPEDIVPLALHFLAGCGAGMQLTSRAEARLRQHHWPGNVRELRHVLERAAILAAPDDTIDVEHLAF
jgi:DNA-binding winged helix-turn-helix (wHTH) protein